MVNWLADTDCQQTDRCPVRTKFGLKRLQRFRVCGSLTRTYALRHLPLRSPIREIYHFGLAVVVRPNIAHESPICPRFFIRAN